MSNTIYAKVPLRGLPARTRRKREWSAEDVARIRREVEAADRHDARRALAVRVGLVMLGVAIMGVVL